MIDFHMLIVNAVYPVKVRPKETYLPLWIKHTEATEFEVSDTSDMLSRHGEGTGVIHNPCAYKVSLFHLGNALVKGPYKINNLPSACDLIMHTDKELIIAELSESNPRSVMGVKGAHKPGKMEKARIQLQATIAFINLMDYGVDPQKRTAIFFFRLPDAYTGVAARSINAFRLHPSLHTVTTYTDPQYPDWEFRNHPYPQPYKIHDETTRSCSAE